MVYKPIGVQKPELLRLRTAVSRLIPLSLRIGARRLRRRVCNGFQRLPFASQRCVGEEDRFKLPVFEHHSDIVKQWDGIEPNLQAGKLVNLRLAAPLFDGLLIRPGDIFSFYHLLGRPTADRGFQMGYEVTGQGLGEGVGGGLCQLATSLLWVLLHAGFELVERHHHDFDLFPDQGRRQPFGTGASVFYNYHDLRLRNNSDTEARLSVTVQENTLSVRLSSNRPWKDLYKIEERNHRFVRDNGVVFRLNEIYRVPRPGAGSSAQLLWRNRARVLYPIDI